MREREKKCKLCELITAVLTRDKFLQAAGEKIHISSSHLEMQSITQPLGHRKSLNVHPTRCPRAKSSPGQLNTLSMRVDRDCG